MDPKPALYLDENVSFVDAARMRARGLDVLTAHEAGMLRRSDPEHLELAAAQSRVLVTHDTVDFADLARLWDAEARFHSGIVLAHRQQSRDLCEDVLAAFDLYDSPADLHNVTLRIS